MQRPVISILIPTHDRAEYLRDALTSAAEQGPHGCEIIVVDDGSTDDTKQVVASFASAGVRFVAKPHTGAPDTRNVALAAASSDVILWLDSDDALLPGTVARHLEVRAEHPHVDVVYGNLEIADARMRPYRALDYPDWHGRNAELVPRLFLCNSIPNMGTSIRRACFERFGGYDTSFRRAHDYEWWSRVAGVLSFKHAGMTVGRWRWHDSNMSSELIQFDTSFDARVLHRMLDRYMLRSLFPDVGWDRRPQTECEAIAYLRICARLAELGDLDGALRYAQESFALVPSIEGEQAVRQLQERIGA